VAVEARKARIVTKRLATQPKSTVTLYINVQTLQQKAQSPQSGLQLAAAEASKARVDTQPDFALRAHYAGPLVVLARATQTTAVIRVSPLREVVARV